MPIQYGSLEIDEDMAFQHRSWRAERIGWGVMVLLTVAALLGFFATGPLSTTTATDPSGTVQVEYERFLRSGAPATFRIEASAPGDGEMVVRLDRAVVEAVEVQQIQPPPARAAAGPDGITYLFPAEPEKPGRIYIWATADVVGLTRGSVTVAGREPVQLSFFIYP